MLQNFSSWRAEVTEGVAKYQTREVHEHDAEKLALEWSNRIPELQSPHNSKALVVWCFFAHEFVIRLSAARRINPPIFLFFSSVKGALAMLHERDLMTPWAYNNTILSAHPWFGSWILFQSPHRHIFQSRFVAIFFLQNGCGISGHTTLSDLAFLEQISTKFVVFKKGNPLKCTNLY